MRAYRGQPRIFTAAHMAGRKAELEVQGLSLEFGGIHALKRGEDGFPLWLAIQVLKTSNGLVTMAAAMLSKLSGEDRGLADINRLLPRFKGQRAINPVLDRGAAV